MKTNNKIKIGIILIRALALSVSALIGICYWSVDYNARGRVYDDVNDVPNHEYGLLLGTSPITPQGAHNFNFDNHIKAAVELYKAGKVRKIIASGGNYWNDDNWKLTENECNELRSMQDSLVKYGVPRDAIILDYDGTRTLNSLAKMREVYRQDSVIVISHKYHNERALYQAKHLGIDAIGYNAKTLGLHKSCWRNRGHEVLARVKMFLDLYL